MKYAVIALALILFNCSTKETKEIEEEQNLLGKWRLIEQLVDPGDGSGTFNSVESERIVEFFSDGTVIANGSLCYMSREVGDNSFGVYEVTSDDRADTNFDGIITPENCEFGEFDVYFDLPLSGHLILWYPCIEGCGQKFVKI
ncbi:hypothetical protein [uncultured Algibacter sp.]|uniref:hypothetical protein n=1 Tax=uncultured Algibacter sp. TaxID=298659 RepID=UPI002632B812|nr:hypothetical protein [uncultured Algibacter sp.]